MNKEQKMDTIKEWKETIDLFGKKREVTITIKTEPDPDAIHIIKECGGDSYDLLNSFEAGNLSVDIIEVEVKCDLFSGSEYLGGCFEDDNESHLEPVDYYNMVNEAIDDYKADAKRYKDFFEA